MPRPPAFEDDTNAPPAAIRENPDAASRLVEWLWSPEDDINGVRIDLTTTANQTQDRSPADEVHSVHSSKSQVCSVRSLARSSSSMAPAPSNGKYAASDHPPSIYNYSEATPTETSISTGLASRFSGVPLLEEDTNGVLGRRPPVTRDPLYECTFWFLSCSYMSRDEAEWETHCLSHFRGEEPPRSVQCPLCDFSGTSDDGWTAWRARTGHLVQNHIAFGETLKTSRPDFHLFTHLWQKRLIDDQDLKELKGGNYSLIRPPSNFVYTNGRRSRDGRRQRTQHAARRSSRPPVAERSIDDTVPIERSSPMVHSSRQQEPHELTQEPPIATQTSVQPFPVEAQQLLEANSIAPTNAQYDSGYGSTSDAAMEAKDQDDASSIRSIITNASRVSLPPEEKKHVILAFSGDLCQDIGFHDYSNNERDRLLARLPDLLKTFALRLEASISSKAEMNAKEFLRQQRKHITHHLREMLRPESPLEDEIAQGRGTFLADMDFDPLLAEAQVNDVPPRYEEVRPYLLGGLAYKWLLDNARSSARLTEREGTILQTIHETINDQIVPSMLFNQPILDADIHMDWDLIGFLKEQEYGVASDIAVERAITVTGYNGHAQALTCMEYMHQTWPYSGQKTLLMIQETLRSPTLSYKGHFTDGTEANINMKYGKTHVKAIGERATIIELCEQLSWLGAALRPARGDKICFAQPLIKASRRGDGDYTSPILSFLVIFDVIQAYDRSLPSVIDGTCWYNMFRNPVVADGFPILARYEDERGLEISANMMSTLAEARFATHYDRTLLLKGFCTLLVPTRRTKRSVTWHFLFDEDKRIPYSAFRQHCETWIHTDELDYYDLANENFRNFVGWTPNVTRHSGTEDMHYEKIDWAGARKCSAGLAVEQKLTISVSKIFGASASFVRGNRDKPEYVKRSAYSMQVEFARNIFVLLYDVLSHRAWLVDGASALLHLVRTQVVREPYDGTDSNFDCSKFNHPPIDGGQASAVKTLMDEANMRHVILREFDSYAEETVALPQHDPAPSGDNNSSNSASATGSMSSTEQRKAIYKTTCFKELVCQTLSTLEQIYERQKDAETSHAAKQLCSPLKTSLEGYEFMDIVSAKHTLNRRFINLGSNGSAWINLVKQTHAITLFGQSFGEIYKPRPDAERAICKSWRTVPRGHEYLAIPVSLLREIKLHSWKEGEVDLDSPELSPGLFWNPPPETFKTCGSGCKHRHNRVQQFRTGKAGQLLHGSWEAHAFAQMNGAVLFGESSVLDSRKLGPPSPLVASHTGDDSHDSGLGSSLQFSSRAGSPAVVSDPMNQDLGSLQAPDNSTRTSASSSSYGAPGDLTSLSNLYPDSITETIGASNSDVTIAPDRDTHRLPDPAISTIPVDARPAQQRGSRLNKPRWKKREIITRPWKKLAKRLLLRKSHSKPGLHPAPP